MDDMNIYGLYTIMHIVYAICTIQYIHNPLYTIYNPIYTNVINIIYNHKEVSYQTLKNTELYRIKMSTREM